MHTAIAHQAARRTNGVHTDRVQRGSDREELQVYLRAATPAMAARDGSCREYATFKQSVMLTCEGKAVRA